jgi:glycosidase
MTYPGIPCIYYGDEIALRGTHSYDSPHADCDARWPFPWHDPACWDREMQAFFRAAIALRHAHPALRNGEYRQRFAAGSCYAFERRDHRETLVVALNAGNERTDFNVAAGASAKDDVCASVVFGEGDCTNAPGGAITISVAGRSGCVIAVNRLPA